MAFKQTAQDAYDKDGYRVEIHCSEEQWNAQVSRDGKVWACYGPTTSLDHSKKMAAKGLEALWLLISG